MREGKAAIHQSGGGSSINIQTGRIFYAFINYAMVEKAVGPTNLTKNCIPRWGNWVLYGAGPDSRVSNTAASILDYSSITGIPSGGDDLPLRVSYDATNGTVSHGDLFRSQKYVEGCEEYPI